MPVVFTINTAGDAKRTIKALNRINRRLPQMTREGMKKWGKQLEKDTKRSARVNGKIRDFRGILQGTGIRYDQGKRSDKGYLFIRLYGIYLDSMAPHWVMVNRRRITILAWAKQARSAELRLKARLVEKGKLTQFPVYVRKHPFITQGYKTARPKLRPILKQMAKRALTK